MIQLANFEEREFYVMLGKVVTSVDVTFTFQMTEEEFTATLTPVSSTLRASKFAFTATTYPEGQYIVKFVETGQTEVLATVAGFVSGNPIFSTSQYNTYNDDGTSTTYVPSDDQGLVPSVSQKLRVSTIDQATDVSYVRYLKVTNGTLTDNGDNSVTLDTGGGGAESLNDLTDVTITAPLQTGQSLIYDHDGSPRGWHNQANTLANLSDTSITTPSPNSFLRYVSGVWQAEPVNIPSPPPSNTDFLPEGSSNLYYTDARVSANTDVAANTAKTGITQAQADAIVANTAKVGITTQQANAITANTAKTSFPGFGTTAGTALEGNTTTITTAQANAITANTAKNSYPSADATKLAGIEENADVTDTANVTAAGALMDSEVTNLAQVKAFDSSDYATAAQGSTADSAMQDVVDDTTPQLGGDLDTNGQNILFAKSGNTNFDSNGEIIKFGTGSTTQGALHYLNSSGGWTLADADATGTAGGVLLAIALGTDPDVDGMLLRGMFTLDHDPGTIGDELYVSTTAGDITGTAPSGTGDIVRVVGYCLDSTNGQIWFNPSNDFIELA